MAVLAGAVLTAGRVDAQPNPSLPPNFGTITLKMGFTPDPFVKKLTAGGNIVTKLGGVKSHVTAAPDFKLHYTAGNVFPLTFHVKSQGDTTLLINLPDGSWIANDDGGKGLNPRIRLARPQSGRYDIWVGTYGKTNVPATLFITELKDDNVDPKPKPPVPAGPNPNLPPTFGSVMLKTGFTPDPFVKKLTAGGPIKTNLGGVLSHVAAAPDYRLNYVAGNVFPLTFHVRSEGDTTLLINMPNGQWIANDDGGKGLNPRITLKNPPSGRYDIYVGTYGRLLVPATLFITELPTKNKD